MSTRPRFCRCARAKAANDLHEQHLASMRAELAHRAAGSKRKRDLAGVKQQPPAKQARADPVDVAPELVPTLASTILQIRTSIQMQAGEPLLLDGPDVARRLRAHAFARNSAQDRACSCTCGQCSTQGDDRERHVRTAGCSGCTRSHGADIAVCMY